MRIMHVVGRMNVGGAEVFVMNLLRNMDSDKHQFIFLCYFDGPYDFEDEIIARGGKIIRIADNRAKNPFAFINDIRRVIIDENIDIVHSHVDFSSAFSLIAAWMAGVPKRIAHAHNSNATNSSNLLRRILYGFLRCFVNFFSTMRLACGNNAGRYFFYSSRSFEVIPNGIKLENFIYNDRKRAEVRERYGIAAEARVVLHIGRFEKQKNHKFIVSIFEELSKARGDYVLLLVGDGSLKMDIEEMVADIHLEDKVIFTGKMTDVAAFYSAADVFIFPSLYEGLGIVAIEAQVSGLKVAASLGVEPEVDLGGVRFIPLWASITEWADAVSALVNEKRFWSDSITTYDIQSVSKKMELIYEN